ncbi:hypothetical protein OUZ56_021014 [Daphnia magna]|uniref:Uncharacterized protein n=1 Tax=Daphnia magna TaxID=35525 RepID=A0ABQ9ZG57_9CRUS|nr:hypothetical protein OUZ56_021014 [Daphnia magna]
MRWNPPGRHMQVAFNHWCRGSSNLFFFFVVPSSEKEKQRRRHALQLFYLQHEGGGIKGSGQDWDLSAMESVVVSSK